MVKEITYQLIDFAVKVEFVMIFIFNFVQFSEYRIMSDGVNPPSRVVKSWNTLFIKGKPLFEDKQIETVEQPIQEEKANENDEILDAAEFHDYVVGAGEWRFAEGYVRNKVTK